MSADSLFIDEFRRVVATNGERVAIEFAGEPVFTYGELDLRARTLATELIRRGAGPEKCVGIAIEKSPEYIVALLATWYAGAAFVPLDPQLPAARREHIISDCTPVATIELADLQRVSEPLAQPVSVTLSTLAYAIFTSGSTGAPKGVLVTHSGITSLLHAQIAAFEMDCRSRSLFVLSTNFDASVSDIGCALLSGATLCIEPPSSLNPGDAFAELVRARRISHMDIPPAFLRVLKCADMPNCLQTVVIGGEACAPSLVREWAARFRIVNVYGPTEATVCSSLCLCNARTWERPLIGAPLPGVLYQVVDEELFIGGIGLARGYLNRPALDETKFVEMDGVRWYRTGDRVIAHPDGSLEFAGRIDRQVKVRGILVEPEEIEARLAENAWIQQAVVLKRSYGAANSSREGLVAFVQLKFGAALSIKELRSFVGESLPRWMIPHRWQFLPVFPRTLTGKVDFDALRNCALESAHNPASGQMDTPSAGTAETITNRVVKLVESVLAVDCVLPDDNLFELGADSFSVIELSLAAQLDGLVITPALLMRNPVINQLSQALEEAAGAETVSDTASGAMPTHVLRKDVEITYRWQDILQKAAARKVAHAGVPKHVLLTGGTGFLGARLLHALLTETDCAVSCLVRCADYNDGVARLRAAAKIHNFELSDALVERLIVVPGDISKPRFGLSGEDFDSLAINIDTVYHCAALVNMLLPYEDLRAPNIEGTWEIVRFMASGRPKWLHYASTLSVFVGSDQNQGIVLEDDDLSQTKLVYGGYAQTKWAAEVLLRSLAGAAGPISIYRFGLIVGDSVIGNAPKNDFLGLFARGIVSLGYVPEADDSLAVDITPVDFACAAMLQLSLRDMKEAHAYTYHIANSEPLPMREFIYVLQEQSGRVQVVSNQEFFAQVTRARDGGKLGPAEAAACLALCRSNSEHYEAFRMMDLFQATNIRFDMRNTLERLQGQVCPTADRHLIRLYAAQFLAQASA